MCQFKDIRNILMIMSIAFAGSRENVSYLVIDWESSKIYKIRYNISDEVGRHCHAEQMEHVYAAFYNRNTILCLMFVNCTLCHFVFPVIHILQTETIRYFSRASGNM